ncbi:ABC transporter ATP-binding protein [Brevibacillus marinus]|uniref:ABC transporter ATP-binding protein n=1 Tax=Brevibacillus marinus TaxID=2496837 RepID=UPI000F81E31A|nr:ABC transporter ATP-binding protein [Brevibacillus marinus]
MIIDLKQVSWVRDKTILRDITWQVAAGEHWSLVGLNGSGKTTLLNIINGYIWPTKGEVSVLGEKFGRCDLRELRKQIGWVSSSLQERLYGQQTAEEIVLSGKFASIGLYDHIAEEDREQAAELLASFGCAPLLQRPYETLSQGERQKVLIARALMAKPRLLILDEPCNGLDLIARENLLAMIGQIAARAESPTLLYVTHHIEEILPCFSHTLLLRRGEIYKAGSTQEVLTTSNLSQFFEIPVHVERRDQRFWVSLR